MGPVFAAAQAPATPVEDVVLGIAEGDGWSDAPDADDQPIEGIVPMMNDGEPQPDFAPFVLDLYQLILVPTGNGRWMLHENGLGYAAEPGGDYEWARWQFPLELPISAPEWSVTLP